MIGNYRNLLAYSVIGTQTSTCCYKMFFPINPEEMGIYLDEEFCDRLQD